MTTRTVQIAITTYTDPSGVRRIGQAGETVDVHPDDLARFAAVNGGAPAAAPKKSAPAKKQAPAKRKAR